MTTNVDLLQDTLKYIETHPAEWNQETWHCGTRFCFAGHVAATMRGRVITGFDGDYVELTDVDHKEFALGSKAQAFMHIGDYARRALGLDADEANRLFSGYNTLADLRRIVGELIEEAKREAVDG